MIFKTYMITNFIFIIYEEGTQIDIVGRNKFAEKRNINEQK